MVPFKKNDVDLDIFKKNDLERNFFCHHNYPLKRCNFLLRYFLVLSKINKILQMLELSEPTCIQKY